MPDFRRALRSGLEANADANARRAEIAAVVSEFSQQLSEETGETVGARLNTGTKQTVKQLNNFVSSITGGEVITTEYLALVAFRRVDPKAESELAPVEIEATGYPVHVSWPGRYLTAHDRASLETIFEELLKHPDTGGKLQRLLDLSAPKEAAAALVSVPTTKALAAKKAGKHERRSASEIEQVVGLIVSTLRGAKEGMRSEQLQKALKLSKQEVVAPLARALEAKKVSKKGQKRATTYFAR